MAISYLPRGTNPGQIFGEALSEGLNTLAQGKLSQMKKRQFGDTLEKMGEDRRISEIPEKFGLKALGAAYKQKEQERGFENQRQVSGLKAIQDRESADQEEMQLKQAFGALGREALMLGVDPNYIKNAYSAGLKPGIKMLETQIGKANQIEKAGWLTPAPQSPYKGGGSNRALTPLEEAQHKKYGSSQDQDIAQQIERILNPTQEDRQRDRQEQINVQLEQERSQNPPNNQLDIINDTAAEQMAQPKENPYGKYAEFLDDPNLDPELKGRIRQQMWEEKAEKEGSWGLLSTPLGILGNAVSGAIQNAGTGFGLTKLANLITPGEGTIQDREREQAFKDSEIRRKRYEDVVNTTDPESDEYKRAAKVLEYYKRGDELREKEDQEKATKTGAHREAINAAQVKENIVVPLAKMFGAEKYVHARNVGERIGERVGGVTPLRTLGILGSGGKEAVSLLKTFGVPVFAETAGELAKTVTGSDAADGVITIASYLLGEYKADSFKKAIKKEYQDYNKYVKNEPIATRADATELLQDLTELKDEVGFAAKAGGNKFIADRIDDTTNKIRIQDRNALQYSNKLQYNITPQDAFKLDQEMGSEISKKAAKFGERTLARLTRVRQKLRDIWEPHFQKLNPQGTKAFKEARDAERLLNFNDSINKSFDKASKVKVPLFNRWLHAIRHGISGIGGLRKFTKQMKNPLLWKQFHDAVQEAALKNIGGIEKAASKMESVLK